MYSYLKGVVTEIKAGSVTVETHGVGYQFLTPNPYLFELGRETTVYVYQKVAEDELTLFGFTTSAAKDLFLKLITVNGIGPKSANGILATGDVGQIAAAIASGNAKFLQKFPGIGPKASQQIILDLQGKIDLEPAPVMTDAMADVDAALQALGYNAKEIKKVLAKLDGGKPANELIKDALKLMLK
ncbi:MAG: Holliday junction branch migration protein RuvA [Candidatus Izemoplasmatales bacterium]